MYAVVFDCFDIYDVMVYDSLKEAKAKCDEHKAHNEAVWGEPDSITAVYKRIEGDE